jgi:hypothetical protein
VGSQGCEPAGVVALFHLFDGIDEGSDAIGNLQHVTSLSVSKNDYACLFMGSQHHAFMASKRPIP